MLESRGVELRDLGISRGKWDCREIDVCGTPCHSWFEVSDELDCVLHEQFQVGGLIPFVSDVLVENVITHLFQDV